MVIELPHIAIVSGVLMTIVHVLVGEEKADLHLQRHIANAEVLPPVDQKVAS